MIPHDPINQEKNYGPLQIDDEIVTNFHVVEDLSVVDIVTYSSEYTTLRQMVDLGSLIEADVVAVDVKRDLALLKPKQSLPNNAKPATNNPVTAPDLKPIFKPSAKPLREASAVLTFA